MNTLQQDLTLGLTAERTRQQTFESTFGSLTKTGTFDSFDYKNNKFFVEHKERPDTYFGQYCTCYFDKVKYQEYLRLKRLYPTHRFVIIWTLKGESFFWEFTEIDEDKDGWVTWNYTERRMDRRKGQGMQSQEMVEVFNSAIRPLSTFR
tara:strand:+ start:984 stop:1430 length:447 start_codon:yes stop_codon:yes gene_type:complete